MKEGINIVGKGVNDPHVHIFNDRAYLYGSHDFSPENSRFVMKEDTEVYDPCLFKDDDGSIYMLFGVWDYYLARMSDDMLSPAEEPRRVDIVNPEGPYGKGKTDDKVFLHKRDGIYYLSWGSYYAMSETVEGPFEYQGCIVDPVRIDPRFAKATWPNGPTQGRHGSFFEWHDKWFFAYCEMCFSGNRYFRDFWISYVHYNETGGIEPIVIDSAAARV